MAKTTVKDRMLAHIGRRITQALKKQPYRGAPSFDDVKVAIVAAFAAASEDPDQVEAQERAKLPPPLPAPVRPTSLPSSPRVKGGVGAKGTTGGAGVTRSIPRNIPRLPPNPSPARPPAKP